MKKFMSYVTRKNLLKNTFDDSYYICKYKANEFLTTEKPSIVSPWHDISLFSSFTEFNSFEPINTIINKLNNSTLNMVVEIPANSSAKMEVSKDIKFNPIVQDYKYNKDNEKYLRYIKLPYNCNYGMLPQTWEDNTKDLLPTYKGDNDPLDCLELTDTEYAIGEVVEVEVLGSFCLIDQNEVDWKILSVSKKYLEMHKTKGIVFLEEFINSGKLSILFDKFRRYKQYEGKKKNEIYLDKPFLKEETNQIIALSYLAYHENIDKLKNL